jgi:4-diphosphocytidyl-2C-methyl-D-erythritol kinase
MVLFVPNETIERKTARMFAALDRLPWDDGSVAAAFAANMPGRVTGSDVYNAFERVAFDVFPGLASVWEAIEGRIGAPVRLAGAGPTLFWIGKEDARAGVAAAARDLDCVVIETATAASLWKQ